VKKISCLKGGDSPKFHSGDEQGDVPTQVDEETIQPSAVKPIVKSETGRYVGCFALV